MVLSLLLTVLWLVVSVLDSTQPYSRDVTQLIITFLLVGGAILSLGVSLLAGARSIRKMRKIMRTLSGPTTARVELEQQVAAMIRDRSQR
ncbi:MAG: hypothetical protein GY903_04085 [Fuerstiella sp.]|nr:hypothetical protein [Fuerstiella sp.]MCP4853655.1 hypothetical protein [Fuerstiella sp.]